MSLFTLITIGLSSLAMAQPSAKSIAKLALERNDGHSTYFRYQLVSCEFELKGKKQSCISKPRIKTFESLSKDVGSRLKDTKSVSIIVNPAAETGVGFYQQDFDDVNRESDQRVYLPSLKKLKRVVSQGNKEPKTGSFFGSELAYEDIEKMRLDEYSYEFIGEQNLGEHAAWIIDLRPTRKRAPKTSYGRGRMWVDKQSHMPLKVEAYDRRGKLAKTFINRQLENVSGVWVARQYIVINHKSGRMSLLQAKKVLINPSLGENQINNRILSDRDFRESVFGTLREKAI